MIIYKYKCVCWFVYSGCNCVQQHRKKVTPYNFGKHFHPVHNVKKEQKRKREECSSAYIRKYFHGQVITCPLNIEKIYLYCCNTC